MTLLNPDEAPDDVARFEADMAAGAPEVPVTPIEEFLLSAHLTDEHAEGVVLLQLSGGDALLVGRLTPNDARTLGLRFLAVAEEADRDAYVHRLLVNEVGMEEEDARRLIVELAAKDDQP